MPACKVAVIFRKYIGDTYSVSNKSNYISVTHLHAHPPVEPSARQESLGSVQRSPSGLQLGPLG
jgi:hypothetical protein